MPLGNRTRLYRTAAAITVALALFLTQAGFSTTTAQARHSHRSTPMHHSIAAHRATAWHHSASAHRSGKRTATLHHASYRNAGHHRASRRRHAASLGQKAMDSQRATQIQQALIQAHYMDGSATGQWDTASQTAMQKYQIDNGWQSKITPDSRALIKLGLGPKQDDGEYSAATNRAPVASGVSQLTPAAPAGKERVSTEPVSIETADPARTEPSPANSADTMSASAIPARTQN